VWLIEHRSGVEAAAELGIDLTLAWHTHGGEFEFIHRGVSLTRIETRNISGWFEKPGGQLYVNRGIRTTGFPIRFSSRPEITVFELVRRV
jgi:predicted MPP superfamily phosphohydrolase